MFEVGTIVRFRRISEGFSNCWGIINQINYDSTEFICIFNNYLGAYMQVPNCDLIIENLERELYVRTTERHPTLPSAEYLEKRGYKFIPSVIFGEE